MLLKQMIGIKKKYGDTHILIVTCNHVSERHLTIKQNQNSFINVKLLHVC